MYGTVSVVRHSKFKNEFVQKQFKALREGPEEFESLSSFVREASLLHFTRNCPFFPNLLGIDWKRKRIFLEKCDGDLKQLKLPVDPKKRIKLISDITYQILITIKYLHDTDIAHLDLKASNIFYTIIDKDIQIKVADPGLAQYCSSCSTDNAEVQSWASPEIFRARVNRLNKIPSYKSTDMFAIGFTLLEIIFPDIALKLFYFMRTNYDVNISNIMKKFDELTCNTGYDYGSQFMNNFRNLLKQLIHPDPLKRTTDIKSIIKMPFFEKNSKTVDCKPINKYDERVVKLKSKWLNSYVNICDYIKEIENIT
jgi:serine/threonine protein kinase